MWRTPTRNRVASVLICAAFVLASGCGSSRSGAAQGISSDSARADQNVPDSGLLVVTTLSPITSLVDAIVEDHAVVIGMVPEGANSHTFEPLPSAAEALASADVIFLNGLQLEEPIRKMAQQNKPVTTSLVALGDRVLAPEDYRFDFSFPESDGKPNPHLWTDPLFVRAYGQVIADTMSELDPEHTATYQANLATLIDQINQLDRAMREAFATIPEANRVLLTYHDAYAYFAGNYGFTVIGAIQPASFSNPSPKDVATLITQVREQNVPAIFGSEVFPSPVLDQISAETGGTYVGSLRDDDLPGAPGDPEHSWFGLLRTNYVVMTEALEGDASALRDIEGLALPGNASYPQ